MNAEAKDVSPETADIVALLATLKRQLAEWTSLDWTALHPDELSVKAILQAADDFRNVTEQAIASSGKHKTDAVDRGNLEPGDYSETTILLAEDNTVNRVVAEGMLRHFRCRIDMVENGAEAVRRFEETNYDLVFMDCQMPVMDGFQAVARIRELEEVKLGGNGPRTPIVALTANALKGDRDRCFSAGMDDYVSKPFSIADLQGALDRQLGVERTSKRPPIRTADSEEAAVSSEASSDNDDFVDKEVLAAIRRLTKTDGTKLLERVIDVFLDSSPRLVADLDAALTALDARAVAKAAHSLRSCCGSVGASQMAEMCKSIELLGDSLAADVVEEHKEALHRCNDGTLQELRRRRDEGASG